MPGLAYCKSCDWGPEAFEYFEDAKDAAEDHVHKGADYQNITREKYERMTE